ncbi:MAG: hypothetical protein IT514_10885, partial [Burkholderiales bacterium]|nr:hypothetical protein [Burkholderiales bacterium]
QDALAQRLASVAPELTGKLSQRWAIWAPAAQVFLQSPWFEPGRLDGVAELRLRWLRPVLGYGPDTYSQVYPLGGRFLPTPVAIVSAHNFFVQTAIELGALGVAAYLGLFGAIAWTLALRLRPALGLHRGAGRAVPDWAGALAAASLGVLTARVLEQCAGVAAVADVHLTWMLAGMAVALAALERGEARRPPAGESRATASEVAAGATAGGRAAKTAPAPRAQPIVWRVPAALLVAGGALTLWTIAVAGEMKAALLWAQARAAIAGGSLARGRELLDRAIALSPAVADYRQERAQLLFNAGTGLQRPAGARSAALWEAYGALQAILARNPLDARARSGTAEILSEIARLNPAVRSQALRAAEALLALQPGYWGSRVVLAGCLLALDLPERALAAVEEGRRLGGLDYADTYRLYALQADALDRLGRTSEALSAARCSVALAPSGFVSGLLQRHGEVSRKPLSLPAQDLAHCPEAQRTPNRRPATNPE